MNNIAAVSGSRPKPLILVILDGWGHREERAHNAIAAAHTPVWQGLQRDYPHGLINASELHVGLPPGQMGNSEVGHMHIGAGRLMMQDLPRIDAAIADGSLGGRIRDSGFRIQAGMICHVMGLLSPGGVHAHQDHMLALAAWLAEQGVSVRIHAFLDGRDTPPRSALDYVHAFENGIRASSASHRIAIATLSGRYYAMDRDKRWERVRKAYDTIVCGQGERFASAKEAIEHSYAKDINDEFLLPCVIGEYQGMRDGDGLMMANFRADRARQLLTSLLDPAFAAFPRERPPRFCAALGMSEYSQALNPFLTTLFPPQTPTHGLGETLSMAGLKQLRIAETEKYAHVTFFFNGGREEPFPGEERILIPSPQVATYDLQPEMSAFALTARLVEAINSGRFDVMVVNYANTDMVGHSGDMGAAIKAVEAVDQCLGRLVEATLVKGGALLITADHGNAETMYDEATQQPHTAHTMNLVPVLLIDARFKGQHWDIPQGSLADIAPTLLQWLNIPQPPQMSGRSLLCG